MASPAWSLGEPRPDRSADTRGCRFRRAHHEPHNIWYEVNVRISTVSQAPNSCRAVAMATLPSRHHADLAWITPDQPVLPGTTIKLYATGLNISGPMVLSVVFIHADQVAVLAGRKLALAAIVIYWRDALLKLPPPSIRAVVAVGALTKVPLLLALLVESLIDKVFPSGKYNRSIFIMATRRLRS